MVSNSLDLTIPEHAYMFGFIQADGHLYQTTRNRGRLAIELQERDGYILEEFVSLIPFRSSLTTRVRQTNFAKENHTIILRVYEKPFRDELVALGMICGRKSSRISPPCSPYSKADYFRGVLDADGSMGFTSKSFPFVSLVTVSEAMAAAYLQYIEEVTGKVKSISRNKRDGAFNVVVYKEDAQALASTLYPTGCLALPRKQVMADQITAWSRPDSMRKIDFEKRGWTPDEDSFIKTHTIEESSLLLTRTRQSVKMRLWRLRDK